MLVVDVIDVVVDVIDVVVDRLNIIIMLGIVVVIGYSSKIGG